MEDLNDSDLCFVKNYDLFKNNKTIFYEHSTKNFSDIVVSGDANDDLALFTRVAVAFILNFALSVEIFRRDISTFKIDWSRYVTKKTISRTIIIVTLILISPMIVTVMLSALLYKNLCEEILKRNDKRFVKFLDSFDVFWSLEDDASKSIINVLGIIESESAEDLLEKIKSKLINIKSNTETDKIFYRRREKYGLYYWRKYSIVDMDEYVQLVDHQSDTLPHEDLANILSSVSKQELPYSDEGLFQILITKQRLTNNDKLRGDYGIIFRIHHSVGDGVALIEFLCKTLADNNNRKVKMFSSPEINSLNYSAPIDLATIIAKLCEIPLCFADGILRKPDENSLHGPALSGNKIFKWTESDENLYELVKEIKDSEGLRFTDILAEALARGLQDFFRKTMRKTPEDVAVVLPVRFPKPHTSSEELQLKNDFSVTILDIPVHEAKNINEIKDRCSKLRKSCDPLTNYYFLKLVGGVLPKFILKPLLQSSQATMIFSNMPGPEKLTICGGNDLKELVFFVPHKGTTGLGITALCYGGVLRFGAMADQALVASSQDLSIILSGMVEEIRTLHRIYVK